MLGGSFYPPHSGHVQISEEAIKKLNLKEVWWIVAQKHPEKDFINEGYSLENIEKAGPISRLFSSLSYIIWGESSVR